MEIKLIDKEFNLSQGEIKTFSISVESQEDIEVYAKVSGTEGECLSCDGKDYLGRPFSKTVKLYKNQEKRFWFYVKAPCKVEKIIACVSFYNKLDVLVCKQDITIKTTEDVKHDEQYDDIYSLRRLVWLNSDCAINSEVPAPFIPVVTDNNKVKILGREIEFNHLGLPSSISSYFTEGIQIGDKKKEILSNAISLEIAGQVFENSALNITSQKDKAVLCAKNQTDDFTWDIHTQVEFDGFVSYKMTLTAKRDISTDDIKVVIPIQNDCSKYFMGLGKDGGLFNGELSWKWDENKQQDGFWVGAVNAGLKAQFIGENYRKPLVNIYYAHKPLLLPDSWDNDGKGGIKYQNGAFIAYTGEKTFKQGESISLHFNILITPLKAIDLNKQLSMRLYHKLDGQPEEWFETAKAKQANIINVHHGNDLNPYINYPFFETDALTEFVKEAHDNDIKVKIYYTIRELTVNTPEFKAFRDLDGEIFEKYNENVEGFLWQGEAKDWIRNNIGKEVIPAWRQVLHGEKYNDEYDASVITNGSSRLCNFYIESLKNLLEKTNLDGLYIDDVAYDRNMMRRVRKVLDQREGRYIDFHTWNHNFNDFAGHTSCAYLYTELFPYIDKLWIGEGFDYESAPDFWLIEMSGIPFGLMSEMLEADWQKANQWKGLVFGMTTRLGWTDVDNRADPSNLWKVFDKYELCKSQIIGFWDSENIIECDSQNIKATLYKNGQNMYIALANFSNEDVRTKIRIKGLSNYLLYCPEIERFQDEATIVDYVSIPKGKGLFIVVKQ